MAIETIHMPEIGADSAEVIEILAAVGDTVTPETSLLTLEGEKATMEVPAGAHGVVSEILLKLGDQVSVGVPTVRLESVAKEASTETQTPEKPLETSMPLVVPELGTDEATVIEIFVKAGDCVEKDQPLLTLEGEKATMELPSVHTGTIEVWDIALNQVLKTGDIMGQILANDAESVEVKAAPVATNSEPTTPLASKPAVLPSAFTREVQAKDPVYAGPATRRIASRFGVDLTWVVGSQEKERICPSDVLMYVKECVLKAQSGEGAMPVGVQVSASDFADEGPIDTLPLNKIKQATAKHLTRAWQTIPHVTQMAKADVTMIEEARKQLKADGVKISVLMIVIKMLAETLKAYPTFNASLSSDGKSLITKGYYHIGVAVDTPNGLVVPVMRDVDQLSVLALRDAITAKAEKARTKGLTPQEMKGGTFTVSSLGGFGGTAFTPIVNAPEVAILGLARSVIEPVYQDGEFVPCLQLPLCLSYDHRVIDGAEGIRFLTDLADRLSALSKDDILAMCQS